MMRLILGILLALSVAWQGWGFDIGMGLGFSPSRPHVVAVVSGGSISPSDNIEVTFSEAVNPVTVTNAGDGSGSFEVRDETAGTWVAGALSSADNIVWTFNPTASLTVGNSYRVYLTTGILGAATSRPYSGTDFLFAVIAQPLTEVFATEFPSAPAGIVYVAAGTIDPYPGGNATALSLNFQRTHFDFAGWQAGQSKTYASFEFKGDDNNNNIYADATDGVHYGLRVMEKPYTEDGLVNTSYLYRASLYVRPADTRIFFGSARFCSTALSSVSAATIDLTKRYRVILTIDHVANTLTVELYNVTDGVSVVTSTPKAMDQNLAEVDSRQPGTVVLQGYTHDGSATAPSFDLPNTRLKMTQNKHPSSAAPGPHVGGFEKISVSQE
jgi:hypothetical protein